MKLKLRAQLLVFGAVWGAALSAGAQQPVLHEDRLALKFEATSMFSQPGNAGVSFVDYVDRSGEPAFRFHVRHIHEGQCEGFLTITRSRIAYDASFTPAFQAHAFEVSRTELKEARPASSPLGSYWSLTFLRGTPPDAALVPLFDYGGATGKTLHAPGDNATLSAFLVRAVGSFEAAEAEFHQLTAKLRPPPQPVPGGGGGQSAMAALTYTPRPPEANIDQPKGNEVKQEKIKVHGYAFDPSGIGIRSVEVMDQIATMLPMRGGHGVEFWVDEVPLKVGDNLIEIVVTNVSDLQGKTTIRVRRVEAESEKVQPEKGPLSVEAVVALLDGGVTRERIKTIVQERGVAFDAADEAVKARLREVGADRALLDVMKAAKK